MSTLAYLRTSELPGDVPFRQRVDALAAHGRYESSAIGVVGAPSDVYACWAAIVARSSPEQRWALLRHESAPVRLYAMFELLQTAPVELERLEPLLDDHTQVQTQQGCMMAVASISDSLVLELRSLPPSPTLVRFLRTVYGKTELGSKRLDALALLGRDVPDEVHPIVAGIVRDPERPTDELLHALGLWCGEPHETGEILQVLGALATHRDPAVRMAISARLPVEDAGSFDLLEALRKDSHPGVSASAESVYPSYPRADPRVVDELLEKHTRGQGKRYFLSSLVHSDHPVILGKLLSMIRGEEVESNVSNAIAGRRVSAAFTTLARQLAAFDSPGVYFGASPRSAALSYLLRARDPDTLSLCRLSFVESQQSGTWTTAADAIISLLSDGSEASLLTLIHDPDVLVRRGVIHRLGHTGGTRSLRALEALEPTAGSMDRVSILGALQHLRSRLPSS